MSYLPAVCDPSSACLPVLRASTGFFSALQDIAQDVWAQGWSNAQRAVYCEKLAVFLRLGQAELPSMPLLGGRAPNQWELVQITWVKAYFGDHRVVMVINEEVFLERGPVFLPS